MWNAQSGYLSFGARKLLCLILNRLSYFVLLPGCSKPFL